MRTKDIVSELISSLAIILIASGCSKSPQPAPVVQDSSASRKEHVSPAPQDSTFKTYRVLARVSAVDKLKGTITIKHEKIDTMFNETRTVCHTGDTSFFQRVSVGTEGHFTIKMLDGKWVIVSIHVHHK